MKKIRDIKALARETLIGKYGTLTGAYFLSGILVFLSGFAAVLCILTAFANTNRFEAMIQRVIPSFHKIPSLSVIFPVLFAAFAVFTFILKCWLTFGRQKLLLNICRGEKYGCTDIFYAFRRGSHPWRVIGVNLLTAVFVNGVYIIPAVISVVSAAFGSDGGNQDPGSTAGIVLIAVNILALLLSLWLSAGFAFATTVIIDRPEAGVFEALRDSLHITKHRKLKYLWMIFISFIFWYLLISAVKIASLWVLPYIESSVIIFYLCARGEEFVIPANRPKTEHVTAPDTAPEHFEEKIPEEIPEISGEEIIITED